MKNFSMRTGYTVLILLALSCNKSNKINSRIQATCLPANLQNGVIAFYTFGNGSLSDVSGNNYNLSNPTTAVPGTDRAGNPNCAFHFDKTQREFLEFKKPTFLDNLISSNLSISFWYKSDDAGGGSLISRDTFKKNAPFCNFKKEEWSVYYVNNILHVGTNQAFSYGGIVTTSNWQHVVFTSSSSNLQFYVDGALKIPGSYSNCPVLNQGDLYIGKYYSGLMDDIIIYNRILTGSEVNQLLNLKACCQ